MWVQKHKPKKLEEIIGNPKVIESLKEFRWNKPLLIYGPPGIGKSALVEAIVNDFDFELVEVTDENIETAKDSAETASIFGKRKVFYIDNVEQIEKIKEISQLLEKTKNPVVMTTSDYNSKRLTTIKKISEKLQMRRPTTKTIEKILQTICKKEGIEYDSMILQKIAENSAGDIRAAINDLETVAKGRKKITSEDAVFLEKRDTEVDIYKALSQILTKKGLDDAINIIYDLDEQPKDVLMWIDENVPYIYSTREDISKAYEHISKADVFMGRIMRRQYWGLLRYANTLMSGGVNTAKKSNIRYSMFKFPSYIIKMSQTKAERTITQSISEKMSPKLHSSKKTIIKHYIPLYKILLKKGKIRLDDLAVEYRLSQEEAEYLSS